MAWGRSLIPQKLYLLLHSSKVGDVGAKSRMAAAHLAMQRACCEQVRADEEEGAGLVLWWSREC